MLCESYCTAFPEDLEEHPSTSLAAASLPKGLHLFGLRKVFPPPASCRQILDWWFRWSWLQGNKSCSPCLSASRPATIPINRQSLENVSSEGGLGRTSYVTEVVEAPVEGPHQSQDEGQDRQVDKGHVAVAGTWLSIPEGQCFCLLGPNGAGKTTTLRCLLGVSGRRQSRDTDIVDSSVGLMAIYTNIPSFINFPLDARALSRSSPRAAMLWSLATVS